MHNMLDRILARLNASFKAKIKTWADNVNAAAAELADAKDEKSTAKGVLSSARSNFAKATTAFVAAHAKHKAVVKAKEIAEVQLHNEQLAERLLVYK